MTDFEVMFDEQPVMDVDFYDLAIKSDIRLQDKTDTATANGTYNYTPDTDYDGLSAVTVNVAVQCDLPTLNNPATAADITSGKQVLDGNGDVLTGAFVDTLQYLSAVTISKDIPLAKIPDLQLPVCTSFAATNVQADFGTLKFELPVQLPYGFHNCENVKEFNFVGGIKATGSWRDVFRGCTSLTKINGVIDMSACTNCNNFAYLAYNLVEIRFKPNTIKLSVMFGNSGKLSTESVQSIIDGLYDFGGTSTTYTLTLHNDVKSSLTNEQKQLITNKNWTLA